MWTQLEEPAPARHIVLIAHSMGGESVVQLAQRYPAQLQDRVAGVFLTDSFHRSPVLADSWLARLASNYITSRQPVGSTVESRDGIPCLSAGTTEHEWTSWSSIDHIFSRLENLQSATDAPAPAPGSGYHLVQIPRLVAGWFVGFVGRALTQLRAFLTNNPYNEISSAGTKIFIIFVL